MSPPPLKLTLEVFTSVVVYEQKQHQRLVTNTDKSVVGKELKKVNPQLLSIRLISVFSILGWNFLRPR